MAAAKPQFTLKATSDLFIWYEKQGNADEADDHARYCLEWSDDKYRYHAWLKLRELPLEFHRNDIDARSRRTHRLMDWHAAKWTKLREQALTFLMSGDPFEAAKQAKRDEAVAKEYARLEAELLAMVAALAREKMRLKNASRQHTGDPYYVALKTLINSVHADDLRSLRRAILETK